jgi:hypothetical protein
MVVSTTLGATLILLAVVGEAASGFLWRDDGAGEPHFYCSQCDLRYTRHELADVRCRTCRHGHPTRREGGFPMTLALISACVTVIAIGLVRLETGLHL